MNKYKVESGDMSVKVRAKTHKLAAIKAIDKKNPRQLGMLISVLKYGDDEGETTYFLSARILEDMGFDVPKNKYHEWE